jgi:hypothetical protein
VRPRTAAPLAVALAIILAVPSVLRAQALEPPRLVPARVAGEVVAGTYAGIGGFIVGSFVAEEFAAAVGARHETTLRHTGWIGGAIGGGLATAGAVYGIGSIGNQAGDFDVTALGAGVGFATSLGLARLLLGADGTLPEGMSTRARWATINALALLPALGATIGFNSTRRIQP